MTAPATFLVVDDSKLHHRIYQIAFSVGSLAGSLLYHALDGREGYGLFTSHPELIAVFLDVNMPGMNGLEFLARRRAERLHPQVPVILVTTESAPEDEARGRAAGAWEYLRKPFQPADIERLAQRARAERPVT